MSPEKDNEALKAIKHKSHEEQLKELELGARLKPGETER